MGGAEADNRPAGDHRRLVGNLCGLERSGDRIDVMTVDARGIPTGGNKAAKLVGRIGKAHFAVDRDTVVVEEKDEMAELEMPGQRDRFLRDAFHQAAVAGHHIGLVVDEVIPEAGIEMTLGDGHAE